MRSLLTTAIVACCLLGSPWARGAEVVWNLQERLLRDDELVRWTSPSAIADSFPSYQYDYEITSVGIYYGGLLTPDDETDRYDAANDLTGSGIVGQFPTLLWEQSLTEPINDTSFDLDFSIDADGYGQATFTEIALGTVLTDFGTNEIPIDALDIEIEVTVTGLETVIGDYNGDLVVDANDYALWQLTYGSTVVLAADGNGDGRVDAADYAVWRDNLTPAAAVSVPEPVGGWLAALAGVSLLGRRR